MQLFATILSKDQLSQHRQDVKGLLSCSLGLPSMLLTALACLPKLVEPQTPVAGAAAGADDTSHPIQVCKLPQHHPAYDAVLPVLWMPPSV